MGIAERYSGRVVAIVCCLENGGLKFFVASNVGAKQYTRREISFLKWGDCRLGVEKWFAHIIGHDK